MNIKPLPFIALVLFTLSCKLVTSIPSVSTTTPFPVATPTRAVASPTAEPPPVSFVPPSCQGQPVATLPPAVTIAQPTASPAANPPITKKTQLKVFNDLTRTISKEYLYPDFNGVDWPGLVAKYKAEVDAGLDTEKFYTEMDSLVSELGDEHSSFKSPVEVSADQAELAGVNDFVGIGVLVKPVLLKNRLTILVTFPDSAAAHGGLVPHDSLLAVDGIPLADYRTAYNQRVRGPECSVAVFTVQSPGEAPRDITLMRYRVSAPLPIMAQLVPTKDGSRIGYIFLPTFFDDTIPGQVKKALEEFGELDGLILDNRMNGGGSSSVVEPIFSYFTSGVLGNFVSRTGKRPLKITADPVGDSQTVPLVVLVGQDTVSFGEIFSGALQDSGRAKIVGETTLGNVETLHGYTFEDGSRVWIAQERFDPAHSHANWEKDGIKPDVEAYADWDTFTFKDDPSVLAALKLLGH